jgi:hypothetical protein
MYRRFPRISLMAFVLALAAIVSTGRVTAAADHWLGTWKLNLARSKYNPPELAPKSQTIRRESVDGGMMKLVTDGVDAQGKATHSEYSARFDGKDYPWAGQLNADSVSLIRIDDEYYEAIWKLKGEVTITSNTVVAKDGKTLTTTQSGKDAQGRTVLNMTVYDRE